jgi:hypothetical protein
MMILAMEHLRPATVTPPDAADSGLSRQKGVIWMGLRRLTCGIAVLVISMASSALAASPAAASGPSIVVVTRDGQHGWHSRITDGNGNPDASYGSVTFVTGPGTPPRGKGSLRLLTNPGKGDGSAQMRNTLYGGVRLADLTELTYYAYSAMNNGQQFPFLALNVSNSGGTATDDILFFEPPYQQPVTGNPICPDQGPTIMNMWQKWDAKNGCWWDNNAELGSGGLLGVQPLSTYIAAHPAAAIANTNGVGGLRLAVGFASPTDQFDGNIDLVTVGVNGSSTSYDFEPPPACHEGDGKGHFHGDHGDGDFEADSDGCIDGDEDQVDSGNRGDGKDFHSTSIDSMTLNSLGDTLTIAGSGTSAGAPVTFLLVEVASTALTPGSVSWTFSDGFTNTGDLLDGSISLN